MASKMIREWAGINKFPAATQTRLLELLAKLKQENVDTLTILVMGKAGVGKSSTVNSIFGEGGVIALSAFKSEAAKPVMVSRTREGFTLNIIDSPGVVEDGYLNDRAIEMIKRFLLNKKIDVLLYLDRLDAYRVDNSDKKIIKVITDTFGKGIWQRAAIVLTHAQISPPDALSYDEFFNQRSEALLNVIGEVAGIKKMESIESVLPVVLVENSGRCNRNENDEKVLPNGVVWISNLVETIIDIVFNGSNAVFVDQKRIDESNPNDRGKIWIPLIVAAQFFLVVVIRRATKFDARAERRRNLHALYTSVLEARFWGRSP